MADRKPPLKVLQVGSSLSNWLGIERYVLNLTNGLRDLGHEVHVSCPPGSPLEQRVTGKTIPIAVKRKLDFKALAAYLRHFGETRYDVIHAHFSPDFTVPAVAARLRKQPFTVLTRHLALRWKGPKARNYQRGWNHFIPVSEAVRRKLLESGIPDARMTVAKAGLPEFRPSRTRQECRDQFGIQTFALGSFSRLVPEKGVDRLIRAVQNVDGVELHIFGDGKERKDLEALAVNQPAVRFHGQITEVAEAMTAMDAIAICSVWEEAFPYAALEAFAIGRPLIAANIGGLPEIIDQGVHGTLYTPDSDELKGAIENLRDRPDLREAMGAAGRERYEREFTLTAMAKRNEAIYLAQTGRIFAKS